jgi:hypothetical protein
MEFRGVQGAFPNGVWERGGCDTFWLLLVAFGHPDNKLSGLPELIPR